MLVQGYHPLDHILKILPLPFFLVQDSYGVLCNSPNTLSVKFDRHLSRSLRLQQHFVTVCFSMVVELYAFIRVYYQSPMLMLVIALDGRCERSSVCRSLSRFCVLLNAEYFVESKDLSWKFILSTIGYFVGSV